LTISIYLVDMDVGKIKSFLYFSPEVLLLPVVNNRSMRYCVYAY
jgi:hypothetical protein